MFASLGVGLPVLIAAAHFFGLRRRDEVWMRLAVRLTRAFTVLVVVGVISGIVISVELVLLWPRFMTAAGPVIGLPFSLETYAFFLEAIFLSLYLFGRSRPSPWCTGPPCCRCAWGRWPRRGIVVAANAWMNAPTGFNYLHGQFTQSQPWLQVW